MPLRYLTQLLRQLARGGIIIGQRGRQGGYSLARPPAQTTLLAIMEAVEGPIGLSGMADVSGLPTKLRTAIDAPLAAIGADARQRLASVTLAAFHAAQER
ncbi:Transcriptional regulator [Lacipirellula limnantheis]|uniref:Transcriptional regulator n=2 Tax=Lacipirellula limnantheis TaxID=2528024 RepID=A0A517TXX9_9BACT|nr:Transcriptional regulator [Lacipirellula limnantheis]